MEKLKNFFKTYYVEVIFGVLFCMLIGFMALPFLDLKLVVGDYTFTPSEGKPYTDTEYQYVTTNLFKLIAGQVFNLSAVVAIDEVGGTLVLSNTVTLIPDATIILTLIFIIVGAGLFIGNAFAKKDKVKKGLILGATSLFLIAIFFLVALSKFMKTYDYLDGTLKKANYVLLGYIFVLVTLSLMAFISGFYVFKYVKYSTRDLVECGLLVAAALVLDKVKFDIVPGAGSVNFAGIPLLILALRHGPIKSLLASSIVFGLISCLIDNYGLQTFPFDYAIAFTGYAMAGVVWTLFKKFILKENTNKNVELGYMILSFVIGSISVIITRMVGSSISSYIYFLDYIPDNIKEMANNNVFASVLLYNILYIGPSAGVSLLGAILLAKPLQIINKIHPVASDVKTQEITEEE